jgi:hypothetical protein
LIFDKDMGNSCFLPSEGDRARRPLKLKKVKERDNLIVGNRLSLCAELGRLTN